jgi:hypothetical protein
MRQEDILLNEAYKKVYTQKPEQLNELFGNVNDARLAGVGGTISGLKNRIVGGVQKGVGSIGSKVAGIDPNQSPVYQKGQAKIQAGKDAGTNAKIDNILRNQTKDINNFATKITNQLIKLGLGNDTTVSDIANGMTTKLKEVLAKQAPATNALNAGKAPTTPAEAPAPTTPAEAPAPATPAASGPAAAPSGMQSGISTPTTATSTPAPIASGVGTGLPEVKPTDTASKAAEAMASADSGTAAKTNETSSEAGEAVDSEEAKKREGYRDSAKSTMIGGKPEAEDSDAKYKPKTETPAATTGETPAATTGETPAATTGETPAATTGETPSATGGADDSKITDQGGSTENETTPEEVKAATPPANAPQPKVNKSTYQSKNANKDVYKFVRTQQGKVWKNQRTKIVPTAAVQSNITISWIRQQGATQPKQQNESFKSFFWNF